MDTPDLPPQYPQVMVVQVSQSQQTNAKYDRTIGVCHPIENPPVMPGSAVNSVTPIHALKNYFRSQEKRQIEGPSTVTVLEQPKHGELKDLGTFVRDHGKRVDTGETRYRYLPKDGYLGKDRAVLLVEIAGMRIKMVYTLDVVEALDDESEDVLCPKGPYQRLSLLRREVHVFDQRDAAMWYVDLSQDPPLPSAAALAQAATAASAVRDRAKPKTQPLYDAVLWSCNSASEGGVVEPAGMVGVYYSNHLSQKIDVNNARITVLEPPTRGKLELQELSRDRYAYAPNDWNEVNAQPLRKDGTTAGIDQATFLVELKNLTTNKDLRVKYVVRLGVTGDYEHKPANWSPCAKSPKRVGTVSPGERTREH